MKPEEQQTALAEACGWDGESDFRFDSILRYQAVWVERKDRGFFIPDYLNDLNAIHEAEFSTFTEGRMWSRYYANLSEVCNAQIETEGNSPMSATAPQRAEALLKTLNLWTE